MDRGNYQPKSVTVAAIRSCDGGIHGPEQLILDMGSYLSNSHFRYLVINLWDGRPPEVELHQVATGRNIDSRLIYAQGDYNPAMVWRLRQLLRAEQVGIIHTHGEKAEVWGYLASRGLGCRLAGSYYGRVNMGSLKTSLHQSTSLVTLHLFDRVLANSAAQQTELFKFGHSSSKIEVTPSYVDLSRFAPMSTEEIAGIRNELGIALDAPVIATVARLYPEKGHAIFIDALAQLCIRWPELVWLVVGDGPLLTSLEDKAHALGLERNIVFAGYRHDLREVLGASDFVISPSLREGMSVAVLDAMAMGKPVIGTAVGGTGEVVSTGKTGILISPGKVEEMVLAVQSLLVDQQLITRLGTNCRRLIEQEYSSHVVCAQISRCYEHLASTFHKKYLRDKRVA